MGLGGTCGLRWDLVGLGELNVGLGHSSGTWCDFLLFSKKKQKRKRNFVCIFLRRISDYPTIVWPAARFVLPNAVTYFIFFSLKKNSLQNKKKKKKIFWWPSPSLTRGVRQENISF